MEDAMIWIFRASTALGAFFLYKTYDRIEKMDDKLDAIAVSNAVNEEVDKSQTASILDIGKRLNEHIQKQNHDL